MLEGHQASAKATAGRGTRRMDVVVFVNGFPLAVIELKNPGDENADVLKAFNQLQTYKREIPSLFHYNELLVISDGVNARLGSLTANREWFKMWRTVDGGSEGTEVVANGFSCRHQVAEACGVMPKHFVEVVHPA